MLHGVGVRVPSAAHDLERVLRWGRTRFLFLSLMAGKGNDVPMSPMMFPVLYGKYVVAP